MYADHSDFEFPTLISNPSNSSALPNDIVFCGKVMHRQSEPNPPQEANNLLVPSSRSLVKSLTRENRCPRSASCPKHRNGLFGILKFPVEMDLSDMKMRQGRREPAPLPKLPESDSGNWLSGGDGDGGKSCWEMVRPLRRRGPLMSVLVKATFVCIPQLWTYCWLGI